MRLQGALRRNNHRRHPAVFDDQRPRSNQRRDLGIPELGQQSPDLAIHRLPIDGAIARLKVAGDTNDVDSRIRRGRVEGEQAAFG